MNTEPVAWIINGRLSDEFYTTSELDKIIPLYTYPAKTLIVSKDDVANLVSSGEYWTLDDHLNIVSVHFDKFAEAVLKKASKK